MPNNDDINKTDFKEATNKPITDTKLSFADNQNNENNREAVNSGIYEAMEFIAGKIDSLGSGEAIGEGIVKFSEGRKATTYGFDSLRYDAHKGTGLYERVTIAGKSYMTPWFSVKTGGSVTIKAAIQPLDTLFHVDSVEFRSTTGVPVTSQSTESDSIKMLTIQGQNNEQVQTIEAYVSYTDSSGKEQEQILGQCKVITYDNTANELVVVPLNEATAPDAFELQQKLNKVYKASLASWNVTVEEALEINQDKWDVKEEDGELGYKATGRKYSKEMRNIYQYYKDEREVEDNKYYLFLTDFPVKNTLTSYMPFKGQFAFISTREVSSDDLPRLAAHELAHGTFRLYHTFSDRNEYPVPQGTTDNLMDYNDGKELHKYQWDYIHDPQGEWFTSLVDEEEMAMVSEDDPLVIARAIKGIQCAKSEDKEKALINWSKRYYTIRLSDLIDELNMGDCSYGHVILTVDFEGDLSSSGYTSDYFSTTIETDDDEKRITIQGENSSIVIEPLNFNSSDATDAYNYCKALFSKVIETGEVNGLSIDELIGLSLCELKKMRLERRKEVIEILTSDKIKDKEDALLKNLISTAQDETALKNWLLSKITQIDEAKQLVRLIEYIPSKWFKDGLSSSEVNSCIEKIVNSGVNKRKYNALKLVMKSVTSDDKATTIIEWLRNQDNIREEFFSSLNNLSSDNFTNIATGVTHLYLTQSKEDIINEGKEVEQENFFVWNPLGNIDEYNMYEVDNGEEIMELFNNAYTTSYRVSFKDNGKFFVNVIRHTTDGEKYYTFELDPFETVSVYFEVKNEHIGVEDNTVTMPGVYLAWLIDVREREATEAFKDFAITVATFYFPAANLTKALKAGNYMRTLWNGFLLSKTFTDKLLSNEELRFDAYRNFGSTWVDAYIQLSKIMDIGLLFKSFANEEYETLAVTLLNEWNNISQANKESFKEEYPEEYELLKEKINLLNQ